jgi:hybrid cluster-associated redox disulfide protein
MKVNENMLLNDILDMEPDPTNVFLSHGLPCLGCPGARSESLKEAAEGHGIDLKKLMEDLNEFLEDK